MGYSMDVLIPTYPKFILAILIQKPKYWGVPFLLNFFLNQNNRSICKGIRTKIYYLRRKLHSLLSSKNETCRRQYTLIPALSLTYAQVERLLCAAFIHYTQRRLRRGRDSISNVPMPTWPMRIKKPWLLFAAMSPRDNSRSCGRPSKRRWWRTVCSSWAHWRYGGCHVDYH